MKTPLLTLLLFLLFNLWALAQTEYRLKVVSVKPSVTTGQDYTPMLNDDLTKLVKGVMSTANNQYIDVVFELEKKSKISRISLYDHDGKFPTKPAEIYALNGASRTLLGKFDGRQYMQWVDITLGKSVTADAIIIRKYGNNFPQKVKVYGVALGNKAKAKAVISFSPNKYKTVGDAPFSLEATSNNKQAPITFTSSNPAVVAVAKKGNAWKATAKSAGTAKITASQGGTAQFLEADDVVVEQVVEKEMMLLTQGIGKRIPGRVEAEDYDAMSGVLTQKTQDEGEGENLSAIGVGDWMEYNLSVEAAGTYNFNFRIAAKSASGQLEIRDSNGKVLSTMDVPATGGVQKWATVGTTVSLPAGDQTLRVYAKRQGWNFNWFEGELIAGVPVPKEPSIINFADLAEKTAADAAFALEATSNNTQAPITFTSSNPAVVAVSNESGTWRATPFTAGTAAITASQVGSDSFLAAEDVVRTQTVKVPLVQSVISFAALAEKTAGDAPFHLIATSNNNQVPVTFLSSNPAVVSVTNEAGVWKATPLAAGTATITASQAGNESFLTATDVVRTQTVKAAKEQAVIAFADLAEKTSGDAAFALEATSNNTQVPITFTSSNPAVVAVSDESGAWVATPLTAGTAAITASQVGNDSFLAAEDVLRTQTVAPVVVDVPEKEPDLSRKSGKLTMADYKATWMYLAGPKPENQNYTKIMDGVLNEKVSLTWSNTLSPNNFFMTFPLGMEFTLEKFRIYDGDGTFGKPIRFHYIKRDATKPGGVDWTRIPGPVFYGNSRLVWEEFTLATPLDLYAIVIEFEQIVPGEIELTGSWKPFTPSPYTKKAISIDGSLRTNSYIWNIQQPSGRGIHEEKLEVLKAFKGVRDYVDWVKIEKVKGQYTFEPASEGGWRYDLVYERLKKEGVEVHACFKNQTPWSLAEFGYSPDNNYEYAVAPWTKLPYPSKPASGATAEQIAQYNLDMANYNADIIRLREDPNSYAYFSKAAFQFAARYGANASLNLEVVKVAGNQQKKIGLGYVRSMECNNETDAGWHGRKRFMTPREYAYFLSVFYDGHMNTMGAGIGVKNADPDMMVVAGGIADNRPAYFQGVIDAWKEIRGYKINEKGEKVVNMACDVWNYHAYSNNGGGQFSNSSWGLPPEMSNMPVRVTDFLQVISEVGNDLPVWITEVGYDSNESSQQALATPTRTKEQSKGDWTIRTILFNIRNGITETYFYQAYDESSYTANVQNGVTDNRTYAASGLIKEYKDENGISKYERRPAAVYMKQLQLFKDFVHQKTIGKDPFVDVYDLRGDKMYALVVPDMVSRTAEYTLDLGGATQAIVYRFVDGAEEFSKTTVPTVGGKLTLTVTETPVFVTTTPIYTAASATVSSTLKEAVPLKGDQIALLTYPNPFTAQTTVQFTLTESDNATLKVYDLQGRVVRQIFSGAAAAGEQKSFTLKAEGMAQGIYIVKLVTGSKTVTQKIVVGSGTVPAS